jgi:hypothetical protein
MPHGNTVPVPLMFLQEASSTAGTRPGCGRYLEFRLQRELVEHVWQRGASLAQAWVDMLISIRRVRVEQRSGEESASEWLLPATFCAHTQ